MFFKIVCERAGANPFVAHYPEIVASDGAVGQMEAGISAVHPDTAKSSSIQRHISITSPILRMMVGTLDRKMNRGRTLPLPIPEKFIQIRRDEAVDSAWSDCAFDV